MLKITVYEFAETKKRDHYNELKQLGEEIVRKVNAVCSVIGETEVSPFTLSEELCSK